jgi:CheY-like chemotaxis protein
MQSDLEAAEAAGFADYVTKPLDLARLLSVVDRLLAR